jgi:hypothetical protein
MNCGLREEVKNKLSWKHYIWITGGILAIIVTFLGVGVKVAITGVTRMLDTSKRTLEIINEVKTNQRVLMYRIGEHTENERPDETRTGDVSDPG